MEENRFSAPAKINLGLEILYKREDGYHELNSIFHKVEEPCDYLRVSESDTLHLTISDPALPNDAANLVFRAVHLFANATNTAPLPKHIHLEKHIPTGAGLGGGSSDAATALKLCNRFSEKKLSATELHLLARALGADVPFFLQNTKCAIARGIGDTLEEFALNIPYTILIAKLPDVSVNTKEAYARLKFTPKSSAVDYAAIFRNGFDLQLANEYLRNDFEESVFAQYPTLGELKHRLTHLGAGYASMSGSGSAIYGLFEHGTIAHNAAIVLRRDGALIFVNPPES